MKLADLYNKPLREIVEEMDLVDLKVHSDEDGCVRGIELKYSEKRAGTKGDTGRGGIGSPRN